MKKIMGAQRMLVQEPVARDWLRYELTEDDFLLGKSCEFSWDDWEDDG